MAKKRPMGAIELSLSGRAADIVAEASGAPPRESAVAAGKVAKGAVPPQASGAAKANPRRKGYLKVMLRLAPDQMTALRDEALRRIQASGANRMDMSEVAREAISSWMRGVRVRAAKA